MSDTALTKARQRKERMLGSEAIIRALEAEGVEICWGIPGGAILPLYDAFMAIDHSIEHVLVRHEQGAGHMAQGYARATGKVGVCIATSGPGATNLVTPIADAFLDSTPIVAITGQVPTHLIGTDAFQEADITGIVMPIVKHSFLVQRAEDIPKAIHEAFHIASTGRPGPVLVDIPKDLQLTEIDFAYTDEVDLIVVATSTPDMVFPSTATIVQHKLGIAGCPAFDLQAVCSGFVYALTVVDAMVRSGPARISIW